jgi:CheY-like chemotaxis protein
MDYGSGIEVLVVDDEPLVRDVVVGNLAEKFPTFRVRQAESGNAALAMINERVPDLLLSDLRMPGLNGFALIRMLRSRDRTRKLPIIVISGLKDMPSVLKALELGATDYVVKPIDFEMLVQKVESICARFLHQDHLEKRNRSSLRRKIHCPAAASMLVTFPEREGLWLDSPLDVEVGEPLLIDGSKVFQAMRLNIDNPFWWSRVEHCRKELEGYQLKLLLDPIPQKYDEQLLVLNRSKERFRRYFGGGQEPLSVDFPCLVMNLSGGGLQISGSLPWKQDALVHLNLAELIHRLGFTTTNSKISASIRWTNVNGSDYLAGVRFEEIDEELRMQIMAYCLRGIPLPGSLRNKTTEV